MALLFSRELSVAGRLEGRGQARRGGAEGGGRRWGAVTLDSRRFQRCRVRWAGRGVVQGRRCARAAGAATRSAAALPDLPSRGLQLVPCLPCPTMASAVEEVRVPPHLPQPPRRGSLVPTAPFPVPSALRPLPGASCAVGSPRFPGLLPPLQRPLVPSRPCGRRPRGKVADRRPGSAQGLSPRAGRGAGCVGRLGCRWCRPGSQRAGHLHVGLSPWSAGRRAPALPQGGSQRPVSFPAGGWGQVSSLVPALRSRWRVRAARSGGRVILGTVLCCPEPSGTVP